MTKGMWATLIIYIFIGTLVKSEFDDRVPEIILILIQLIGALILGLIFRWIKQMKKR